MGYDITVLVMAIAAAWFVSTVVILAMKRLAPALGLVDRPRERRCHDRVTPAVGGIGIAAGFFAALFIADLPPGPFQGLLAGVVLLAAVGIVDDIHDLRASIRLLAQLVAVLLVVMWGDLRITQLGNLAGFGRLGLWVFSVPFTVLCIMLMVNAINMLDGADGLAGGLATVALLGFSAVLYLDGGVFWVLPLILAAAVAGFLVFNLPAPWRRQASVFMGDAGSTVLGFALAWLAIFSTQPGTGTVYPVTVAWILILPAVDALSLFFRRMAGGRNPLSADRWHLHHIIVRAGYEPAAVIWSLIGLQAILVMIGVIGWWLGYPEWLLFWPLAAVFVAYQICFWRAGRVLRWLVRRRKGGSKAGRLTDEA